MHSNELPVPMCSRCRQPIILGHAYKDVRASTGPSVYYRRHYRWLCTPCFANVSKHSTID